MDPPTHLQEIIGGGLEVGDHFVNLFKEYNIIQPNYNVLDVGCGVGRIALPLTKYLHSGTYFGFDIFKDLITWSDMNITKKFPQFKFKLIDIKNNLYNPKGSLLPTQFTFPYGDNNFDLCISTSVFTHMRKQELVHYIKEITRVLKLNKICFATFFLINEQNMKLIKSGKSTMNFTLVNEGYFVVNAKNHEQAIGYDEKMIKEIFAESGLIIDSIKYGNWSGRDNFTTHQDIIIAHKQT